MNEFHWRSLPYVDAPSHEDRNVRVKYAFAGDITGGSSTNFRNTPIFMAWAHVAGFLPPINCIAELEGADPTPTLTTLCDAVACFQGVERPYLKENNGESVLVYIVTPSVIIEYKASMTCLASARVPKNSVVLAVQVLSKSSLREPPQGVSGSVTRIEAMVADPSDRSLPVDYATRYRKRCW